MVGLVDGYSRTNHCIFGSHKSLLFYKKQSLTAKQAIWAGFLSKFWFDIVHIPGKQNMVDPASRCSDYVGSDTMTYWVVLLGH